MARYSHTKSTGGVHHLEWPNGATAYLEGDRLRAVHRTKRITAPLALCRWPRQLPTSTHVGRADRGVVDFMFGEADVEHVLKGIATWLTWLTWPDQYPRPRCKWGWGYLPPDAQRRAWPYRPVSIPTGRFIG